MKIPKLFKKAAAFVMAAVTALSIMPATAFAAGDIGTISFSHTYDSNGNAMRYNSSANIGGYTAGGTGNYKYRMFVDGENAFCIQPGVPLKTGNTLKKASSDTWNALSANQKKAVGLALLYGYQGNQNNLSGSDDEKWLATQTLVWEFVTGCREATGSYNQTSTTVYSLHFGSNYANSGARAVYDQIVAMLREHNTIPSFMSGGKNDITKELAYKDGKYSITLNDSNGVLSDYSFLSSDSNVSVSKSGNKLTISSTVAISGSVRITAKRNNVPTVSSSAKLIAYGDSNLQDLVTGVENADTVSAYINIETPTGTIALKKTSEDGVVEGISFTIKGDNFNKTVKTRKQQRDTEEMLDRISSFDERLLYVGITIVIKASSREKLEERTEKVRIIGKTHNMDIVLHSHRQLDALNTSLPTGARFVNTMRTITSEELSIFIPFNVQEIHDDLGYCYGFNKVSKNLIIGNRKLLKNGNGMVFGVPGSGKSYNEKSEMGQVLCFSKDDIIVVDPMGEYKGIAAAWGGQYINLTQSAENVFYVNPFHVPDEVPDIDRFVAEKAEFAYAICEQALKPAPLTSRHIAVIDKAVSSMYEEYFRKRKDKRRRKNRPESPTIPVMRNRIMELYGDNEAAKEIVEQLEVFADGTLDIFAREQSISDENRFTVYGFSELGKRMRAMAMLVMIESITAKIKYNQSDGVATWVYVDEMHELWGEEYSLHALEKMWREVRKRGGICTGMSQNLIDAKRNRSTKTMVSNSEFMLLLDQGTMDKEAVEDLFDISSEQLACVNGAEPGTGLIRFGDKIVPFDNTMEKDSSLYRLFNTNFHEMVKDKNVKQIVEK